MFDKSMRAFKPAATIIGDATKVFNLKRNTMYRIVITADVWMKFDEARSVLVATPAQAGDILMPIGVHFVSAPAGFMSISVPASANVVELT